tara:strand:- start:4065 stop:6044 length:1980 start_codon:yes stop_codon:yes gene_type:complete
MDTIKKLLAAGKFDVVLNQLQERMLSDESEERKDALYYSAVALRYLGRLEEAHQRLDELLDCWSDFGRGHQELGHTMYALGREETALQAYYQALKLNPALYASWDATARIEAKLGNLQQAELNAEQAQFLQKQPKQVVGALNLFHEGKLFKAERICRAYLQRNPHHVEAMRTLALIGAKLDVLNDAEFLLESVLVLAPDYNRARYDYIKVLQRRQKFPQALAQAKLLRSDEPYNPLYKALHANLCSALDNHDEALSLYDELLSDKVGDVAGVYVAKGHLLKTLGDTKGAVACYQQAYQLQPLFGDAFWSLANLKTYRFDESEYQRMQAAVSANETRVEDKIHLNFALGKALEQQEAYDESFSYYRRGNVLKRETSQYKSEVLSQRVDAQVEYFDRDTVARWTHTSAQHRHLTPIFIVGLPRSGSTLVEQILAAHSQVDSTLELPNIPAIAHELNGRQVDRKKPLYPYILDELSAQQVEQLAQRYVDETRVYRSEAPFFTDKMPNNFRHIGLIKRLFPEAKIIDARRDPMDCCWSAYKQLFAEGQEFSYGFDTLADYYRDYLRMMKHWNQVFPGQIYTVFHERLVNDPELQITNLLNHLELEVEQQCFSPHQSDRSVKTASSEQVRQPINTKGIGQWRKFEAHLAPLKKALGDVLSEWAY